MNRRRLLLAIAAFQLRADDAQDVWELFTALASALSEGNAVRFMKAFDRSMKDYAVLEASIAALLQQAQVQSSIEVLNDAGDGPSRSVELDWFLQIVDQQDSAASTRRRERVRCRLAKQGKTWQITALEPLAFFAPLRP
ncbi:MAG: hypothetical protein C5B51_00020 [Terriglobia bacterium]|nr:MAG: hypothetical protein C5B51_00020 [Terriglobia bacterium]